MAPAIVMPVCSARRRASTGSSTGTVTPSLAPPATRPREADERWRTRRSATEMPAAPTVKPMASNANRASTVPKPVWRCLKLVSAPETRFSAWLETSMKMNARIPTENIASATRTRSSTCSIRPNGRPM